MQIQSGQTVPLRGEKPSDDINSRLFLMNKKGLTLFLVSLARMGGATWWSQSLMVTAWWCGGSCHGTPASIPVR
jgi:hypothetical protein